MPLIVTDEQIAAAAKRFYPGVDAIYVNALAVPEFLVERFETIFCSMPRDLFDEIFFFAQQLLQKKVHTVWCPHGNSDKGNAIFFMEALHKEEMALVYGKQMIDFLKRKSVFDQLKQHVIVGNYRYEFYLAHKDFYDSLVRADIVRKLSKAARTILYAPTWQDYERSGSFFDAIAPLAQNIPSDINLLVKLHPNLLEQHDFLIEEIIDRYHLKQRIVFLSDFTPIYPLLNIADVYIGDMSSIGYDFLAFDRPLFFLNQNGRDSKEDLGLYLFRTGIEIQKKDYEKIYQVIEDFFHFELRCFSQLRKDVYLYAFGHKKSLGTLKTQIEHALALLHTDDELRFF